ncbi:MAG: hypothetical protein KIH89_003275 [Candidatus Shapirobacteria bacterium]|nr:hypothetical protein [Candidatus Shapirobacteria bacterium]
MTKEIEPITVRNLGQIEQETHERVKRYLDLNEIFKPSEVSSEIPMVALRAGYYGEKLFQESPISDSGEIISGNDR